MNGIFTLNWSSIGKGLVMAVIGGAILPILAMAQTPGFDVTQVNMSALITLALNGAIAAFSTYIIKEFFSDNNGKVFGRIG